MKNIFFVLMSMLMIGGISSVNATDITSGQEISLESWGFKTISQNLNIEIPQDLKDIKASFCNDGWIITKPIKYLKLKMRPWETKEICIAFKNLSESQIALRFWFGAGKLQADGVPVCDSDTSITNDFAKYIIDNTITGFIIPGKGTVVKNFMYRSPKTASWTVLGCAEHLLDNQWQSSPGSMFILQIRNVGYIQIDFTWDVYRLGRWNDIKTWYGRNKDLILKIIIGILIGVILITILKKENKKSKKKIRKP